MGGIPGHRRERIEAAVVAGGRQATGPHEAWITADPFRGGFKVLITGRGMFVPEQARTEESEVLIAICPEKMYDAHYVPQEVLHADRPIERECCFRQNRFLSRKDRPERRRSDNLRDCIRVALLCRALSRGAVAHFPDCTGRRQTDTANAAAGRGLHPRFAPITGVPGFPKIDPQHRAHPVPIPVPP
jgi:hypothetical protein